jgi:tellurite resistance protein TerC
MTSKKALFMTGIWIALSGLFSAFLCVHYGAEVCFTYLTCYTVEKLLSFDNLLMFYVIFKYFSVSEKEQNRALNIGIISSFVMRASLIFPGTILIQKFHWLTYFFAAFLIYSSVKIFIDSEEDEGEEIPEFIIKTTKLIPFLTRLGLVIAVIEVADLLFALDSIPVAFGITSNSLIIYSANIFAILGLRSMYFVMRNLIQKFTYLESGIAVILGLTGVKMLIGNWYECLVQCLVLWLYLLICHGENRNEPHKNIRRSA